MYAACEGGRMSPPSGDDPTTADPATADSATATTDPTGGGLDDVLPRATVDSRWWYWIAAVPVYFAVSAVLGGLFFAAAVLGLWVDVGFALSGLFVFALAVVVFGLPGLALSVLFPVAVYVDARAVREADVGWDPDPALYGIVALAGVVVTAFTVSVPLALYYLYRRHEAVGTP